MVDHVQRNLVLKENNTFMHIKYEIIIQILRSKWIISVKKEGKDAIKR